MSKRRAVIACGSGRYADPWHPFATTSTLLAELLTTAGFTTVVEDDVDAAMTRLDGVSLLVVNAGDPWRGGPPTPAPMASAAGFRQALHHGIGILGMHTAPATMRGYPEWAPAVGAIWLPGISTHPPASDITVTIHDPQLAVAGIAAGGAIRVFDERYCQLQPIGQSDVVATHTVDGTTHPAVWRRQVARSRVAVDLLGHDERSYASETHRALVVALARWAADPTAVAT